MDNKDIQQILKKHFSDDEIKIIEEYNDNKKLLNEELLKIGNRYGQLIASPGVCCHFQQLPDFKKDMVELVPEETEHIYRYGYYKNMEIMMDYYARKDYIKFIEKE